MARKEASSRKKRSLDFKDMFEISCEDLKGMETVIKTDVAFLPLQEMISRLFELQRKPTLDEFIKWDGSAKTHYLELHSYCGNKPPPFYPSSSSQQEEQVIKNLITHTHTPSKTDVAFLPLQEMINRLFVSQTKPPTLDEFMEWDGYAKTHYLQLHSSCGNKPPPFYPSSSQQEEQLKHTQPLTEEILSEDEHMESPHASSSSSFGSVMATATGLFDNVTADAATTGGVFTSAFGVTFSSSSTGSGFQTSSSAAAQSQSIGTLAATTTTSIVATTTHQTSLASSSSGSGFTRTVEHILPHVDNQGMYGYCVAFATAQWVTIIHRMWKPNQNKELLLSPQEFLNEGIRRILDVKSIVTSPRGLYTRDAQPYVALPEVPPKVVNSKRYAIGGVKYFRDPEMIEEVLVRNFKKQPGYPILANCYTFDLTRKIAREATPENPHLRSRDPTLGVDTTHAVVITGIHITPDKRVSVQFKNSWGKWGIGGLGHTWVTPAFFKYIAVPKRPCEL